jgi:hypothetical protein
MTTTTTLTLVGRVNEDGELTELVWDNEQGDHHWDCCKIQTSGDWGKPIDFSEISTYFPAPNDQWRTFNNDVSIPNAIPDELRVGYLVGYSKWTEYYAKQPQGYKKFKGFSGAIPYWMDLGQGRLADRHDRGVGYKDNVYMIQCHDDILDRDSYSLREGESLIPEEIVPEVYPPAVIAPPSAAIAPHQRFFDTPGAQGFATQMSARTPSTWARGGNTKRKSSIKRKATRRMSKKRRVSKHKVTKRRKPKRKNTRRRRR